MENSNSSKFSRNFVTMTILIVLFLVFLVETFMGGSENLNTLIRLGAMNNQLVAIKGQWWRLFTAQFLHIGWLHIASNAVMIYYLGQFLEPLLGHWRFLGIYLLSGVGGNLLSFGLGSDGTVSAGASTALFGLFGAVIAMYFANRNVPQMRYLGKQAIALAVINIVLDLFASGIDILGHIGGLVAGFLLTIVIGNKYLRKYHSKIRILAVVFLIIYIVFCVHQGMVISN
ncbi:rhomboid family intramembrane serine protease [Lactobacillus sp.]|uniref:rhomboid family intramembrane serine protease n=1 Tax=Lactobacillus sp. TaxID=1591 RepID=UPI0019B390D6|nr:rhomboid family intramembrane serine protease [Lactobacillus sp.]MBD5429920.1 rhomboid family intramembrane serine protease [Lactobacillus sp.]